MLRNVTWYSLVLVMRARKTFPVAHVAVTATTTALTGPCEKLAVRPSRAMTGTGRPAVSVTRRLRASKHATVSLGAHTLSMCEGKGDGAGAFGAAVVVGGRTAWPVAASVSARNEQSSSQT